MGQNIIVTDNEGKRHTIFYHRIVDAYANDAAGIYQVSYQGSLNERITCKVDGEKGKRLYAAALNGVLDLDEGDFVETAPPA